MAVIAITNLTSDEGLATQSTAFTTASVAPVINSVLFCSWGTGIVAGTGAPAVTVTGLGLTWTPIGDVQYAGSQRRRIGIAYALPGGAAVSGPLSLTPQSSVDGMIWSVDQATGADAAAPIVPGSLKTATSASATSLPLTLDAALRTDSRPFALYAAATASPSTPQTGWTELSQLGLGDPLYADHGMAPEWRSDAFDAAANATWGAAHALGGLAFEIAAGAMSDYQADLRDATYDIAPYMGSDIVQAPTDHRVFNSASLAVVASVVRLLVIDGVISEAQFQAALDAARASAFPSEAPS